MQDILLRKLIEKQHFAIGTEINATYKGVDLTGQPVHLFEQVFTVTGIFETKKTKNLRIDAISTTDGQLIRIGIDNIVRIDGMTPERFAENYMIDTEGKTIAPSGKRRGRRPKGYVEVNADDFDTCEMED